MSWAQLNHGQLSSRTSRQFYLLLLPLLRYTTTRWRTELTVNRTQSSRTDERGPGLAQERIHTWYLASQCRHCSSVLLLCRASFFLSLSLARSPLFFARSSQQQPAALKAKERETLTSSLSAALGSARLQPEGRGLERRAELVRGSSKVHCVATLDCVTAPLGDSFRD